MPIKHFKNGYLTLLILLIYSGINAQRIIQLQKDIPTSIRGLSVVDDSVAWVSGSHGYIGLSRNGGKNWNWQQVKGFEKSDFRDIEAFSDKAAIIMSSGTPALILKTIDGGVNWQVKYKNTDTAYFFDAMDFNSEKHGLVLGDPIKNKFILLETNDSGDSWQPFKLQPDAMPGEAAFAASGTCLRIDSSSNCISIVTGGAKARLLTLYSSDNAWGAEILPIQQGKSSQGAFSTDISGTVFVGGDYSKDKETEGVASWIPMKLSDISSFKPDIRQPDKEPTGFQSCIEFIFGDTFLSTGTSGSNITTDGGKNWSQIDITSYNVCRKAKRGKLVLLAGDKGKIGVFKP